MQNADEPRRRDIAGWLLTSAAAGTLLGAAVAAALWRPLLWLPAPPGALREHAIRWLECALSLPLPKVFGEPAGAYGQWLRELGGSDRLALLWRCALAGWAATLPALLMWPAYMRPGDGLVHLRGARRWEGAEAAKRLRSRFAREFKAHPDHEIAPGVPYPSTQWTRQALIVGGTGSGKSTVIKPLIDKIVQAREPLLLFDPKGDFTAQWPGLAILAPWDARSLAWDIARDVRGLGDARKFAEALVVGGGNDPMWANAARQILVGLLLRLKVDRGDDWGWAELASLLAAPLPDIAAIMAETHPEALRAVERASVTTQGILINLASFCAPVFDLARAWGSHPPERRVSFCDWALGRSPFERIVMQGHESYSELARCYVRGVFEAVSSVVASVEMEDDASRKLWIVADECALMGKIPIRALFAVGRSRGVRCVLACQDFAQIEEIHGEKLARSMLSMCGTVVVAQMQQGETADVVAKMLGSREVERATVSTSSGGPGDGSSTHARVRGESPIYKPSELGSRLGRTSDGRGVVCALIVGGEAHELFWPMHTRRKHRPQHVRAEWTSGARPFVPLAASEALPSMARPAPPVAAGGVDGADESGAGMDVQGSVLSDEGEVAPSRASAAPDGDVADESSQAIDADLARRLMEAFGKARGHLGSPREDGAAGADADRA